MTLKALVVLVAFVRLGLNRLVDASVCGSPFGWPKSARMPRIINGDSVTPNAYPWLVSLRLLTNAHFCAGAIISSNFILTAGHCVQPLSSQQMFLVAGKSNIRETIYPQDIFYVSNIYLHGKYTAFLPNGYDIALLRLNRSISFSDQIMPVCLPPSENVASNVYDIFTIVAGWGTTNGVNSIRAFSSSLLQTTVRALKRENICSRVNGNRIECVTNIQYDDSLVYCAVDASSKLSVPCFGDSGSPLIGFSNGKWIIYGITSFVEFSNTCKNPSFYTQVAKHLDWIRTQLSSSN